MTQFRHYFARVWRSILKITVSEDVYSLLKRLAGVKETFMNKVVGEAIDLYLESEHARELIDRHNLED